MSVVRHLGQMVIVSLWRRKSLLMAAITCTSILIICLQYSSVGGQNSNNEQPDQQHLPQQQQQHNFKVARPDLPLGMEGPSLKGHKGHQRIVAPRRNLSAVLPQDTNNVGKGYAEIQNGHKINGEGNANGEHWTPKEQLQNGNWPNQAAGNNNNWGQQQQPVAANGASSVYIPPMRLVHFDLKGAPPRVSYFKQLFPLLKEAGANGILLEYEDMFPFWGILESTAATNAYTKEDVKAILNEAKFNNLEVIPLVQTFGHLEFVLKLEPFRKMREVDDFPQAICPSRNDSFSLVKTIIDQVVSLHPNIKWLHIGCDEVYHMGYCNRCMQQDRENLFLTHVTRVARYVRQKYQLIPIIWDDMLRQIPTDKLKQFKLNSLVEPMVWTYVKDIYRFIPYNVWLVYSEVFPYIWAASAFKGAFGETLTVPNVKMHLENNEAWLEVMQEQHKRFQAFRGIALTGWQRYDHFGALCELLPSGIPSLFVSLITVSQGSFTSVVFSKFMQILQCTSRARSPVDFDNDPNLWQKANGCFYPGSNVFRMTQHHNDAIKRINDYLYDVTIHKAWLTDYNVRHNLSSPMRVDEGLTDYSSNYYPLTSLIRTAKEALREVYDEYTVAEWIEQNIYPYILKMEKLWHDSNNLKKAKVWPKRPLPPLEDLKRFQIGDLALSQEQQNNNNRG